MNNKRMQDLRKADGENYSCALPVFEEKRLKETSDDFILPDFLPDVRKVISVFPSALIKERFLGSGTLEYTGEARYKVLYAAEDQSLKTAVFVTGFEDKIGKEELTVENVDLIFPVCENVNLRMLNPRKVNIRSMCGANVKVFRRADCLPQVTGAAAEDEARLECETEELRTVNVLALRENGLTLSDDLSFEAAAPSASELLFFHAEPVVQDCRTGEGEVQLRGKMLIFCMVSPDQSPAGAEETEMMNFTVPFSQTLKNENLHEGGECFTRICPEGCEMRLREDEFGQKRVLEFDMTYLCDLTVFYPKKATAVKDVFSLDKVVEPTSETLRFYKTPVPLRGGFSVSESLQLDLPEDGGFKLVQPFLFPDLHLAASPDKDGNAALEGNCRIDLFLRDSAGAPDVRRTSLPLRFRTDKPTNGEGEAQISCSVSGARLRLEKNKLNCDFEINFAGQLLQKEDVPILSEVRVLPEKRQTAGKRGSVIICFPEKGEDLFSIAKRYGVPVCALSESDGAAMPDAPDRASGAPIFITKK